MFVKFPSIMYFEKTPAVWGFAKSVDSWVVTEKIDGANFSLIIDIRNHSFEVGKRTAVITNPQDDVSDLWQHRERFQPLVDKVIDYYHDDKSIDYVILYGEFYGPKIMRRIDYGKTNNWALFALMIVRLDDQQFQYQTEPFSDLVQLLNDIGESTRLVPILGFESSVEKALAYKNDDISKLTVADSIMEGIVVTPWNVGCNIRFKVKNEKFIEVSNNKARVVYDATIASRAERLHNEFLRYCTENRMESVFSKFGTCKDRKLIGKYLGEFTRDALEEFERDFPEFAEIDDTSVRKIITNVGAIPYEIYCKVAKNHND